MTGGEALYADMGHFGKRPVRFAWFSMVWPALVLNYFGQGAMILDRPQAAHLPLYQLVPVSVLPFMVLLATAATIIASQATITGAFSVTRQCIQLDFLPRLRIRQTSAREHSQIYVPAVNWFVLLAVCLFVLGFRSSDALGAAYGAAVAGTMFITTLLGAQLALAQWRWPHWRVAAVFGPLMLVDLVYLTGNLTKFAQGAWVPLTLASALFSVFMIWRSGRRLMRRALRSVAVPLSQLSKLLANVPRVPGTAVFLASDPDHVPTALLRNLEHNHVAHERIVFLNVEITRSPRQDPADRVRIAMLLPEIYTDHRALRLHGDSRRQRGAQTMPGARSQAVRSGLFILPWLAPGGATSAWRLRGRAPTAVRRHAAQQCTGGRVFPHARAARNRAGDAGGALRSHGSAYRAGGCDRR